MTDDGLKCGRCGKLRHDMIDAMPMTSLRYRLLGGPLCYGHKVETVDDVKREAAIDKNSGGPTLGAGTAFGRTDGMSYLDKDNL